MKPPNPVANFLEGMGSIFDFFSPLPKNPYEGRNQAEITRASWQRVGDSIRGAMKKMDEELGIDKNDEREQ